MIAKLTVLWWKCASYYYFGKYQIQLLKSLLACWRKETMTKKWKNRTEEITPLLIFSQFKVTCNPWWTADLGDSNADLMLLGSLQKVWPRKGKKEKDSALLSRCTRSSPASGPGQSVIAVEYQESRFVWDSATSAPASCMYVTDGPIRQLLHAAQGRCPGPLGNWSEEALEPSWRSKAAKSLVQLKLLGPPKPLLWWHFLDTSKHVATASIQRYMRQTRGR